MKTTAKFEEFFNGYIDCAIWSSTNENGEPLDNEYDSSDISEETFNKMREECQKFFNDHGKTMNAIGTFGQHGHDFWLSRNGHGTGFWDRGYGEEGDNLHKAAQMDFGPVDLYVGDDDDEIYQA